MGTSLIFYKATAVFYFFSTVVFLFYMMTQRDIVKKVAVGIYLSGFVIHSLGLIVRYFEAGYVPLLSMYEGLSFFAWATCGFFFFFNSKFKVGILGAFVAPLTFMMLLVALTFDKAYVKLPASMQTVWKDIHIPLAFLGYGMFAIAALAGVMYLLQEHQLKTKKMNVLYHVLPSLQISDKINYICLTYGFPLLTLAMITGSIWLYTSSGVYWSWSKKEIWSFITWLVYAALLHGRMTTGWRGRKVAVLSIVGFIVILFTFLGVNLLLKEKHIDTAEKKITMNYVESELTAYATSRDFKVVVR